MVNEEPLLLPGSQLKYLAEQMDLWVPADCVIAAMRQYVTAVESVTGQQLGLKYSTWPADVTNMIKKYRWPPSLNE
eukprot:gene7820-8017_t